LITLACFVVKAELALINGIWGELYAKTVFHGFVGASEVEVAGLVDDGECRLGE
jgi:hypothetical protein